MYLKPTITLLLTLLLPLTSTTPLNRRDASTVIADLNTISADIADFDAAVNVFDGSLAQALAIQTKENKMEDDIQTAIGHTQSSAAFTTAESTAVTNTLLDLEPDILSSLNLVVSKKTLFVKAGVKSLVHLDLQNLKAKTDGMSTALQAKVTAADKATIASHTVDVDAAFNSAISAFS
ncbi:hypothetical protein PHISCL_09313 [Aspergillus sclerotialis]|uniref:Cell wall mannoprotein 1 n=1 Tax=Aspergillus sclerotialis TaxID=2070753 RepID=A0A3A2ZGB1_9EURO|nr:hypothetical protein PHISCL_09313 [Aspergillus sclerotialis]